MDIPVLVPFHRRLGPFYLVGTWWRFDIPPRRRRICSIGILWTSSHSITASPALPTPPPLAD